MRILSFLLFFAFCLTACEETTFTPKPRAFPKVTYPEKDYQQFDASYCHFTFEYPKYAVIQQDTSFFDTKPADPCWFNIYFPAFEARIHCSYAQISKERTAEKLKSDAFKMTDWHNKKATYIDDQPFRNAEHNVKGVMFNVEGPAASQVQFFLTDTAEQQHFFRGALYFYTQARPDSLAPVFEFVKKDVERMLETFQWK